jgi:PKD repeat protein
VPRLAVFAVAIAAAATLAAAGPAPHGRSAPVRTAASTRLLGVTGNATRFKGQTGQASQVVQAFLGWNQGLTYGAPFASLIPTLAPVPMLHLGTGGGLRAPKTEVITPGAIAAGRGDAYLIALNKAIAGWAKGIYVRPLAEMNNADTLWSGYRADGSAKDANHSPAAYRRAFARIYLILHGGSAATVDAKLKALGMPPVSGELLPNPFPRLRIVWSPLASDNPRVPGNAAQNYYPGAAYVDVEGGDIYDERLTDTAPWNGLEALARAAAGHGKPFSVPEWGLNDIDDPAFVKHMCSYAASHRATEVLAYYNSAPGSPFDLGSKPRSRAQYRTCLTPLRGGYPQWAAGNQPGAAPKVVRLTLSPSPAGGISPLPVVFAIQAELSVPIVQWQLYFGDGQSTSGSGAPPTSVEHTYATDALYHATLIVYPSAPFTPASARFLAGADVTAGTSPQPLVAITATPSRAPLAITFQIDLQLPDQPTSWQIAWGDGRTDQGAGSPPHFTGHTYAATGTYQMVLVVQAPSGTYVTLTSVTVAVQPAQGTVTGTVLINGVPFTGGPVPYGSKVDVTKGRLTIQTDVGTLLVYGAGVTAQFVLRRLEVGEKTFVELRLTGGKFGLCKKKKRTASSSTGSAAKKKKTIRSLWGSGKGSFRTRGRYAAATVRGTKWLTADLCTATRVRVAQGLIAVNDFVKHKVVLVRAGHSYVAQKKKKKKRKKK